MSSSEFDRVLEDLIESEEKVAVDAILFVNDEHSLRMAAAWRRLRRRRAPAPCPLPEGTERRWLWLWAQVEFDVEDWARLANVHLQRAKRLAIVLVDNRIVYPDGSLNLFAAKYVQKRALKIGNIKV